MPTATRAGARLPLALTAAGIGLEIGYPLVHGTSRDRLTVATVVVLFAATTSHAWQTRGPRWTGHYLAITLGLGLAAEAVGVATGLPFGDYRYAGSLGTRVLAVPVVVPLAWAMFGYPCLLAARRLVRGAAVVVVGAWGLVSWDLFLDPQMVDAGHWRWTDVQHPLPGSGMPLSNTAGWLLVALAMMALLHRLPWTAADDRLPLLLLVWTYASSVLANAVFFDRPGVALLGGVAMGLVVLPLLVRT